MKIELDVEKKTVVIDGTTYDLVPKTGKTLIDLMTPHIGVKEYNGIVADIQKWFYGSLVKMAWCATCVSYFANLAGILPQLGGKNENVYHMMCGCMKTRPGQFYDKRNIPVTIRKNDIVFLCYDTGTMTVTSNKHVTVCCEDSTGNVVNCLGGNQNDSICVKGYWRSDVYAIFRPVYGE